MSCRPRPASRCRRLYVSPTQAPNAFATGRNPRNAAVCCTEGILQILDERELRGVLGHELMHVYNRDILTSSVAGALASAITFMANFALLLRRSAARTASGRIRWRPGLMFLGPLAAGVIQMAVSRTREYDADEDGAELTGDPLALASALRKLELRVPSSCRCLPRRELVNASHMMIANPFRGGRDVAAVHYPPADGGADRPARGDGRSPAVSRT